MPGQKPTGETSEALSFLNAIYPEGPWALTAVGVDQKFIETRTFYDDENARPWIEGHNGQRNLYWHVNPVRAAVSKKAQREHIAALSWLHVDIDPRAGEDLTEEQERALAMLTAPPGDVPAPTVILFSGGGYQGFWKLEDPLVLDGNLEAAEEAKRYNLQLEILFDADHCHNIDRIMRLPGTVNLPDRKKRKKGRKPVVARVELLDLTRVYPLARFAKAPLVQNAVGGVTAGSVTVSVETGNVERLSEIDDLDEKAAQGPVPDWCKVLIVQGTDPNEPTKYASRSEALFTACCELIRRGVEDDVIYAVITDPDFGISGSVLDKGRSAEKYALRQIERAHEQAINPKLRELNERFAVIGNLGGKCRVVEEIEDEVLGRERLTKQTFEDFRNRFLQIQIQVGVKDDGETPVKMPLGKWWLQHEQRRQYDRIVFAPRREVAGSYNLWRGFSCEARPGKWDLLEHHIRTNVCKENEEHYTYLMGWLADCVQNPGRPAGVAIVLRGNQGTGKGFFIKAFGSLWGRHFLQISDPKHLVGSFNAHLRDCVVLFGDEAFYAGDKKHESILKMLITENMIAIEAKGVDVETSPNYVHLLLASNNDWVVPAGANERRFFVLDMGKGYMQNKAYFAAIQDQLDRGGREAFLYALLSADLSGFNQLGVPQTAALREQKMRSYATEEEWWHQKLERGTILRRHTQWENLVACEEVIDDYLEHARRMGYSRRSTATTLGRFLLRVAEPERIRTLVDREMDGTMVKRREYVYKFQDLDICRELWNEKFGDTFDWPDVEKDEGPVQETPF